MRKFEEGDRIVRIVDAKIYAPLGYSCEVTCDYKYINVDGDYEPVNEKVWQLENLHIHHDLILAWAKGAKIQILLSSGSYADDTKPSWVLGRKYRIKPTFQTEAERTTELLAKVAELEKEVRGLQVALSLPCAHEPTR